MIHTHCSCVYCYFSVNILGWGSFRGGHTTLWESFAQVGKSIDLLYPPMHAPWQLFCTTYVSSWISDTRCTHSHYSLLHSTLMSCNHSSSLHLTCVHMLFLTLTSKIQHAWDDVLKKFVSVCCVKCQHISTVDYLFPVRPCPCTFFTASSSFCSTRQSALLAASMSSSSSTLYLSKLFSSTNFVFCFCSLMCCLVLGPPASPAPAEEIKNCRHTCHTCTVMLVMCFI